MTNEEAIEYLETDISRLGNTPQNIAHKEALSRATKALSQQTEDAISRETAIGKIKKWLSFDDYNDAERHIMKAVISELRDMPSVTPKQRTGHWEWNSYDSNPKIGNFHCTVCHNIGKAFYVYCPKCGAKMEG